MDRRNFIRGAVVTGLAAAAAAQAAKGEAPLLRTKSPGELKGEMLYRKRSAWAKGSPKTTRAPRSS
jgi:FtsP/CotA-like multicopper oxidase with cupredoxin domain